jgi:hypothetical protein
MFQSTVKNNGAPSKSSLFQKEKANDAFIQPKLNIGKSDSPFEKEADRIADNIVASDSISPAPSFFSPKPILQKQPEEEKQQAGEQSIEVQQKPIVEHSTPIVQLSNVDDAEEVQQKEDEEIQQKEDEQDIQKQSSSDDEPTDTSALESNLGNSKGGGSPMPSEVKNTMESGFGTDFSQVRIHNDSNAVQMNRTLGSQAFANGSDIYFNEGKYNPQSNSGKHLLAHELTHTIQQGASVQPKLIQRVVDGTNVDTTTNASDSTDVVEEPTHEFSDTEKGTINTTSKTIRIPNLPVPTFKANFGPSSSFTIPRGGFSRKNTHIAKWEADALTGGSFTDRFNAYATQSNAPNLTFAGKRIYYLVLKGRSSRRRNTANQVGDEGVIFGSIAEITRRASRPYWKSNGEYKPQDVDHKRELQIGGAEEDTSNMWMLESSANRSSGSFIRASRERKVTELLTASAGKLIDPPATYEAVKENYEVTFENGVIGDNSMSVAGDYEINWEMSQIKSGDHLSGLKFLTEAEVEEAGLRGSPEELVLFTGLSGGRPIKIPWDEEARAAGRKDGLSDIYIGRRGGALIEINTVIYNSNSGEGNFGGSGRILCSFPVTEGLIDRTNLAFFIRPLAGVSYGGYIERDSVLNAALHALDFKYMSPITLSEAALDDDIGLRAIGNISPSIPLIGNTGIELVIDERGVRLRKIFQKSDYNIPSPFEITNSTLEVFVGTEGFGIAGEMNFKINNVGDGFLRGNFSTERGFALAGGFNFDSQLFDPASIEVSYENEVLTVSGTIGIPEGKIQGVKNATITASYSENTFTANGEAELDIPGIQRGTMNVVYNDEGFSIGGQFQLKDDIPGIRGGSVSATISKQNGEEDYTIMVSGTAQPAIPGIDSTLTVTYDNGALTIEGSAAYSRGMLSGTVQIGATNRAIGDDGNPNGDPDDTMRVYGGGSLTLTFTPWLQATAGVKFLPNGEIEVTGRIGLPSAVDVFDRKSIDRNLFNMPAIEIPIFAIPLGPRSIGLVARITGGLDFSAGFGPGQIRDLYAEVTYNPDREEETTITGRGEFAIPADAGLTLRGDLGLGVSVGIASLTGGIEIAGALGLEGEAAAEVDVNWSPQTGLVIDATGRITVNPKFSFDINAFARASLDLWLLSISETWRYNLASFSWGPDIQFGIVFPIHYREGEPFDLSFDDLEVIYPQLDIGNMATNLARDIKDDIF